MKELVMIQSKLNAPKSQKNVSLGYNYRSCEDILEAVKKLLLETACTLTLSDDIVDIADRVYIKATATIRNANGEVEKVTAYAREPLSKKGQDEAQITGATSSYARKYALCGLLAIDDNKDPDATNTHGKEVPVSGRQEEAPAPVQQTAEPTVQDAIAEAEKAKTIDALTTIWYKYSVKFGDVPEFKRIVATKGTAMRKGGAR